MRISRLFLLGVLGLTGCAHSVHLYQADSSRTFSGKLIESNGVQHVIFWIANETNYVDEAFEKLKAQCPNGRIEGINTRYSTSLGFFSWYNKIRMRGYCLPGKDVAQVAQKPRHPNSVGTDSVDEIE